MAQLAIAVGGLGIGAAFGAPGLGLAAGELLGGLLFPTKQKAEPHTADLSYTASTYGNPVQRCYGTARMAGNVIWAPNPPIREVSNKQKTTIGGKGGLGTSKTTTYSYYASFAVAFAAGEADDILRIWADTKLIFDKRNTGTTVKDGVKFNFYPGSETQLQDGIIVADKGIDNTPAYRGLCYIVFDNLPLEDFGNRIPNITAELTYNFVESADYVIYQVNSGDPIVPSNTFKSYDAGRKMLYLPGNSATDFALHRYRVPDMLEDLWATATEMGELFPLITWSNVSNFPNFIAADPFTGYLVARKGGSTLQQNAILKIDPNSLRILEGFPSDMSAGGSNTNSTTKFQYLKRASFVTMNGSPSMRTFLLTTSESSFVGILDLADMSYVWGAAQQTTGSAGYPVVGQNNGFTANIYWMSQTSSHFYVSSIGLTSVAVFNDGASYGMTDTDLQLLYTYTIADLVTAGATGATAIDMSSPESYPMNWQYDPDQEALIGLIVLDSGIYAMAIDIATGDILWLTLLATQTTNVYGNDGQTSYALDLSRTQFYPALTWDLVDDADDGHVFYYLDKFNGQIVRQRRMDTFVDPAADTAEMFAYDIDLDAFVTGVNGTDITGKPGLFWLNRGDHQSVTLDSIVSDICGQVGLDSSDIDVTDLASTEVTGFLINAVSTARDALTPLMQAYFFDGIEEDYQLKFKLRGQSSVATVSQADLGADNNGDFWPEQRAQEQELPMRTLVKYTSFTRDYQVGSQSAKRAVSPFPTMHSVNTTTTELPIVMEAPEAKQIAEKLLYNAWLGRSTYTAILSWEFSYLSAGDVITVDLDDGSIFSARITKIEVGADWTLAVTFAAEQTALYSSNATADENFDPPVFDNTGSRSNLVVHNIPLVSDLHDSGRTSSIIYMQASPLSGNADAWPGTTVYFSRDNINWLFGTRLLESMTFGTSVGTLGAPVSPFATDVVNTITIWPTFGGENLASITSDELLDGALNMMLIGDEIINFQNVTDNGDGSFTLDTFLRGRRGTDTVAGSHSPNEAWYIIENGATDAIQIAIGDIGNPMYFKAVATGRTLEESTTITMTPTGEDLKPYAPVNVTRTADTPGAGDITLEWERRTRINGNLMDGSGSVPLNEDSESYSIDILSGDGGSVLRTLTASTTSVVYEAADVVTDFGSPPATLYLRIYQISAQVGRGKSYQFALPIA